LFADYLNDVAEIFLYKKTILFFGYMADTRVVKWVRDRLKEGIPPSEIRKSLLRIDYDPKTINDIMKHVSKSGKRVVKAGKRVRRSVKIAVEKHGSLLRDALEDVNKELQRLDAHRRKMESKIISTGKKITKTSLTEQELSRRVSELAKKELEMNKRKDKLEERLNKLKKKISKVKEIKKEMESV